MAVPLTQLHTVITTTITRVLDGYIEDLSSEIYMLASEVVLLNWGNVPPTLQVTIQTEGPPDQMLRAQMVPKDPQDLAGEWEVDSIVGPGVQPFIPCPGLANDLVFTLLPFDPAERVGTPYITVPFWIRFNSSGKCPQLGQSGL